MKTILISGVLIALVCTACGTGTTNGSSSIAAVTSGSAAPSQTPQTSCTGISNSRTCTITLTYNSGGQSGLSISSTSTNTGNPFTLSPVPSSCSVTNSNSAQQCPITVTAPASTGNTESITFSLGGQTSNVINLSN